MGAAVSAFKSQQVAHIEGRVKLDAINVDTKSHPPASLPVSSTVDEEDMEPEEVAAMKHRQERDIRVRIMQDLSHQISSSSELMKEHENEVAVESMASAFLPKRKQVKNTFKYEEFESIRRAYNEDLVTKQLAKISRSQNQAKFDKDNASSSFLRIHRAISDLEGWGPGLRLSYRSGEWRIAGISKHSGASLSGILVNDKLQCVDSHDVSGLSFDEIRSLLLGPKDSSVVVVVSKSAFFRTFNQHYVLIRSLPSASFNFSSTEAIQKTLQNAQIVECNETQALLDEQKEQLLAKQKQLEDEEKIRLEELAISSLQHDFVSVSHLDYATVSMVQTAIINHVNNMGIPCFFISIHNRSSLEFFKIFLFQLADRLSTIVRSFSVEPVVNIIDDYHLQGSNAKSAWRSSVEQGVSTNGVPLSVICWELEQWNAWQQWMQKHYTRMTETNRSVDVYKKHFFNLDDEDFIQEAVHIFTAKYAARVARIFVFVKDAIEPSVLIQSIDTSLMRTLFQAELPQVGFIYRKKVKIELGVLQLIPYASVESFFGNTKHPFFEYFLNILTLFLKHVSTLISSIRDCGPDIRKLLCSGASVITSKFIPSKQPYFSCDQTASSYESVIEQHLLKQPQHFILHSIIHDWENNPVSSKPGKKMFFFTPETCGFSSALDWIYESLKSAPVGLEDVVPILIRVPKHFNETGLAESKSLIFALHTAVNETLADPTFNFRSKHDSDVDVSSDSSEHLMEALSKLLSVACKQLCVRFLIMVDNIHYIQFDTDSMGCMQWAFSHMPENVRIVFPFLLNSLMQRSLKTYVNSMQERAPTGSLDIEFLDGLEYRRVPVFTSHQRRFFNCFVRSGTACQVLANKLCEDYFAWYLHVNPNMDSHIWLLIAAGYIMVHHLWAIGLKPIEIFFPSDFKMLISAIIHDFSTVLSGSIMLTAVRVMSAAKFGITMTEIIKVMMIVSGHRDKIVKQELEYHHCCRILFEHPGQAQALQRFCCILARMEGDGFSVSSLLLLNNHVHLLLEDVISEIHGQLPEIFSSERMKHVVFELLQFSCNAELFLGSARAQEDVVSIKKSGSSISQKEIPSQLRHLLIITDYALHIGEKRAFLYALRSIRMVHARIVMGCVHWVIGNILQALRRAHEFDESDFNMIFLIFRSLICHKSRSLILEIQPDLYFSIMSATPSKECICNESSSILENFHEPWLRHSNKQQYFQFPIIDLADLSFAATAVATSKRGQLVAAGDFSGKLAVWRVSSSDLLCIFTSHSQAISSVAFSSLDYIIISCSSDCSININSVYSSSVLTTISPHSQPVTCLDVWSKDSEKFATVSRDGFAAVTSLNLRAIAARSTAWKAVKNGTIQTEFTDEELGSLLLQPSSFVFTFKVVSFDVLAENVHTNFVDCIACHPLDKAICATGSRDASIFVWKVDSDKSCSVCIYRYLGHRHWILSLDWMTQGYTILSSSMSSAIHVWRVPYEDHFEQLNSKAATLSVTSVKNQDGLGKDNVTGGDTVSKRNVMSGKLPILQTNSLSFNSTDDSNEFSEFDAVRMFIEREERQLASGSFVVSSSAQGSDLALISIASEVEQGAVHSYISCHVPSVALDLSDPGFPWQTKDRNKQFASCVRFLGTESMWLLSIENESLTYNVKDHILTSLFRGHSDKINSMAFNPLLDIFFTASSDKCIKAWDISRAPEFKLLDHGSLSRVTIVIIGSQFLDSHNDAMDCTFFFGCFDGSLGANKCHKASYLDPMISTDYSLSSASLKHNHGISSMSYFSSYKPSFPEIVASGDENGGIMLWNAEELKFLRTLATTRPSPIVAARFFLPEVALGEDIFLNLFTMTGDAFCVVWNAESGIAIRFLALSIPSVSRVQISPNSSLSVLSHPSSSSFTLFDYVTLANLGSVKPEFLTSESQTVKSLTLSLEGERCAVGSSSGDICLLESNSRQIIALGKHHQKEVHVLLWTGFMNRVVSSSADMTLAFWDGAMVPYGGEFEHAIDLFSVMTPIAFSKLDATLTVIQDCKNIPCKTHACDRS